MAIEKRKQEKLRELVLTKKRSERSKPGDVSSLDRTTKAYNRLAEIKTEITKLEGEYSRIFDSLDSSQEGLLCAVNTPFGKLSLQMRVMWKAVAMSKIFTLLGKDKFLQNCSISKTGIERAVGTSGFDKLQQAGAVEISSSSKFYKLSKKEGGDNGE